MYLCLLYRETTFGRTKLGELLNFTLKFFFNSISDMDTEYQYSTCHLVYNSSTISCQKIAFLTSSVPAGIPPKTASFNFRLIFFIKSNLKHQPIQLLGISRSFIWYAVTSYIYWLNDHFCENSENYQNKSSIERFQEQKRQQKIIDKNFSLVPFTFLYSLRITICFILACDYGTNF